MIFLRVNSVLRLPCVVGSFPPSPACLQGWGGGGCTEVGRGGLREARRQSLPIRRKTQEHKPWVEQAGMSCPIVITLIFAKTGIQFLYLEMYSLNCKWTRWDYAFCTLPWAFTIILMIILSPISIDPNPDFIEYQMGWKGKSWFYFFDVWSHGSLIFFFFTFLDKTIYNCDYAVSTHPKIGLLEEKFQIPAPIPFFSLTALRSSVSSQCKPWY